VHEYRHAIDNRSHSRIPVVLIHEVRVVRHSINDFGSYEISSTLEHPLIGLWISSSRELKQLFDSNCALDRPVLQRSSYRRIYKHDLIQIIRDWTRILRIVTTACASLVAIAVASARITGVGTTVGSTTGSTTGVGIVTSIGMLTKSITSR